MSGTMIVAPLADRGQSIWILVMMVLRENGDTVQYKKLEFGRRWEVGYRAIYSV